MTLKQLDDYIRKVLPMKEYEKVDSAINGLQISSGIGEEEKVKKIAFAVDASLETIRLAKEAQANVLFVHHGFFWGKESPITGNFFQRVKSLVNNDIALYAVHLPLDGDILLGHNAKLADLLGLENREPLGSLGGNLFLGISGEFISPKSYEEIKNIFLQAGLFPKAPIVEWINSSRPIKKVGLISGGGFKWWEEAKEKGVDLFITGETLHQFYHSVKEASFNTLTIGHYFSERWGLLALQEKIEKEFNIPTCFLEYETLL